MPTPTRDLTNRTLSGLLWTAWGTGAQAVIQLVVLVVLARLLAPAEFGVVSAALVVINFSRILYQFGLGPALVQRPVIEARHVGTAVTASAAFAALLGAALWLLAPLAARAMRIPDAGPVLRALAWMFPLLGLGLVPESLLQRELRFRWLANLDVAAFGVGYGAVGVTAAALGFGVWSLVAAHLGQSLVRTAVLLAARPPGRPSFDRRSFDELMYIGGGHTLARVANFCAHQGDNVVVGRWLGAEALGLYGRAYQLMATPATLLAGVLDKVLFPVMARMQGDAGRLAAMYTRGVALIAMLVLPASALLLVLAPELVRLALGPRWDAAVVPFQLFAAGMLFRTSEKMSDSLARAVGAVYRRAWRQALYAALVVGGAWAGTPWGTTGAAIGVLAALGVNFFVMAHLSLDVAGLTWRRFAGAHVPPLLLSALIGAVAAAAAAWARARGLGAAATVGGAVAAAVALALPLAWALPRVLVGAEGLWMLEVLRAQLAAARQRRHAGAAPAAAATIAAQGPRQ